MTSDDVRYFKEKYERDKTLGRDLAAEKSRKQFELAKEIFEKQNVTTF